MLQRGSVEAASILCAERMSTEQVSRLALCAEDEVELPWEMNDWLLSAVSVYFKLGQRLNDWQLQHVSSAPVGSPTLPLLSCPLGK